MVPTLGVGGMELALSRIVRGLEGCGLRHSVVCLKGEPVIQDQLGPGVAVYCMHARANELLLPWRLRRLILSVRPTVIHVRNWGAWPDVALARLAILPPVPLVFSFHGLTQPGKMPWRRVLAFRALAALTTSLFTVSGASRRWLIDQLGLPAGKTAVIPNGVDTDRFRPAAKRDRSLRFVVGTVGSLTPIKDHSLLIRACADLVQRGVDLELRIAGEGPDKAMLAGLAESLGLSDRVRLVGHVDDVPGFLQHLDVFALSSRSEQHPNALLEAMACGLPCVATTVGGVAEILDRGRCGLLVAADDHRAMARAIEQLANGPELREELAKSSRARVCERFNLDRMVSDYAELYLRLSRRFLKV